MKKIVTDYIMPIIVALILAMLIRQFIFYKIVVPTGSMSPTIEINDQLIVTKVYSKSSLKRGDVVVFKSKELNEELIKRLIGLPNDTINITEDGKVYVNGKEVEQKYVVNNGGKGGTYKVPAGKYFFLGDNRINSFDSRYWKNSYISWSDIQGKARFIVYPFNRIGFLKK
ncbi:signal peptidase I [Clostridium acidisoli DSM 12555]|jgi:signal peptidase I|uniref:Signal peptidase I n=1 Tax=Clostridium acidisoli DSM 12555 TaxID=1121291 RepID=A0A1W1XD48_9CLOT|nr:signal peptidase I [Clostridium acidisoli]SMC21411.1 signal peptidase I [Clostridium acidisoli DSM 12555]